MQRHRSTRWDGSPKQTCCPREWVHGNYPFGSLRHCQSDLDILAACPSPAYFRNARKLSQPRLFRSIRTTIKALTDHTVCGKSSHSISWLQVPAKSSTTPPIRLPQRENYRGEIKTELQAPFLRIVAGLLGKEKLLCSYVIHCARSTRSAPR